MFMMIAVQRLFGLRCALKSAWLGRPEPERRSRDLRTKHFDRSILHRVTHGHKTGCEKGIYCFRTLQKGYVGLCVAAKLTCPGIHLS